MADDGERREEEPADFLDWAKEQLDGLKKAYADRRAKRVEDSLSKPEELKTWDDDSRRADELDAFLRSDFWLSRLEPLLRARTSVSVQAGDPRSLEEATVDYLLAKGRASLYSEVLAEFREWRRRGDEGRRRLIAERRRNEELNRLRNAYKKGALV